MRLPDKLRVGKRIQKQLANILLVMVLSFSGLAGSSPLFLSQKAYAATSITSSSSDTGGWSAQDGTPSYVDGPTGSDGNGSLKLTTDSQSKQNYFKATSTSLSTVSGLGYKVYTAAGVPASYQLQVVGVHRTDSTSTFTSLVWEPVYNGQTNGPNGGFVAENNLETGIWWSSHPIDGDPLGNNGFVSLSAIQAANPSATVIAYGVNIGSGTPNATSYVDDVSFGGLNTNFEMAPQATSQDFAICAKNSCGYDGMDVGFSISDFNSISGITVTLSKNGQNLVTNIAKQPMLDYYNNGTGKTLSSPFVVSAGSFNPTTDTYWSYGSHTWSAAEQPNAATVSITGVDSGGVIRTVSTSNTHLTQDLTSFASFFPGSLTVSCNSGDYSSLSDAVNSATAGNTIFVCGNQTITSAININTQLNIIGLSGATINTAGSNYALLVSSAAAGTVINGLNFVKTDSASVQNLIGVQGNNVTISNNTFTGQYNLGDSGVSRAIEVSGVTGVNISGNTISHMRQPAYINAASGTISNNLVKNTRGWVVVSDANVTFTGNSWGTGSDSNFEDIAIIQDSPAGANNYPDVIAISQANNNAVVENQVSHQKTLGTAPIATPTVSGGTSTITLPANNDLMGSVTTPAGTVTVSVPKGTIVTASSNTWDGIISAPKVVSVNVPAPSGYTTTVATAIEVGSTSTSLSFDHAARLVLPGQTGRLVGFIPAGGSFNAISTICGADDQTTVDAQLTALSKNECKYDNGTDMIIWTKHFTTFVAYSQSAAPVTTTSSSNSATPAASTNSNNKTPVTYATSGSTGQEVLGASTPTVTSDNQGTTLSTNTQTPSIANASTPKKSMKWYMWLLAALLVAAIVVYVVFRMADTTETSGPK